MTRFLSAALVTCAVLSAQSKLTPLNDGTLPKIVASHKGQVVLVDFWATYCVPCRAEMPQLVKMSEKLRARGLDFVTFSTDELQNEAAAFKMLMENAVAAP